MKQTHALTRLLALAAFGTCGTAMAQEASYSGEFERPWGFGYGEETRAYDPGTRDANGNRAIINGRIQTGDVSSLSFGLNTGWGATHGSGMIGTGGAVGNQLNVSVQGNNNTIIVDSTQINNGDQTVYLNGELDLNDD